MMFSPRSPAVIVVWWRSRTDELPVPRRHRISWVDPVGQPHGWLEIHSHHIRLDQPTIETALAAELDAGPYETAPPALLPVSLADQDMVSVEAALIIAGHEIHDRGLVLTYGLDILAGISAQLYANGPRADMFLEETLSPSAERPSTPSSKLSVTPPSHLRPSSTLTDGHDWARIAGSSSYDR